MIFIGFVYIFLKFTQIFDNFVEIYVKIVNDGVFGFTSKDERVSLNCLMYFFAKIVDKLSIFSLFHQNWHEISLFPPLH